MAFLDKEYKYEKEENFEAFLKAAGLPEDQITKFMQFKPSSKLMKNGDTYTYISTTPLGARETSFKSGVEFDDVIDDKFPIKTIYTVNGNTITQEIKSDKGNATFKREYNGEELVVTITADKFSGVAKRFYKA